MVIVPWLQLSFTLHVLSLGLVMSNMAAAEGSSSDEISEVLRNEDKAQRDLRNALNPLAESPSLKQTYNCRYLLTFSLRQTLHSTAATTFSA